MSPLEKICLKMFCLHRIPEAQAAASIHTKYFAEKLEDEYGINFKDGAFLKQLQNFTRYAWITSQSFCWNRGISQQLIDTLTVYGLCYTFNLKGNPLRSNK